jgi:hypothetical protein
LNPGLSLDSNQALVNGSQNLINLAQENFLVVVCPGGVNWNVLLSSHGKSNLDHHVDTILVVFVIDGLFVAFSGCGLQVVRIGMVNRMGEFADLY